MRLPANVQKGSKDGIYVYRRVVPKRLRAVVGLVAGFTLKSPRREFVCSLRTRDPRDATRKAVEINALVSAAFDEAEARVGTENLSTPPSTNVEALRPLITREQAHAAIARWSERETARAELIAFNNGPRKPADQTMAEWRIGKYMSDLAKPNLPAEIDLALVDRIIATELSSVGLPIKAGYPIISNLRQPFAAAWLNLNWAKSSMGHGHFESPPLAASGVVAPVHENSPAPSSNIFLVKESEWIAQTGQASRQAAMYLSDVRQFSAAHPFLQVHGLTKLLVQEWLDGLTMISPATTRRKLSALRNYWSYLQSKGLAPDTRPFNDLRIRRENEVEKAEGRREPFSARQVCELWTMAETTDRVWLGRLIRLAAYTGARLESLCKLRVKDIRRGAESRVRVLHFADKSGAGVRDVPIHSCINGLIDQLAEGLNSEDYLIQEGGNNKHGRRSNIYSTAFTALRNEMGFDQRYVFHSIRMTFSSLMKAAGIAEATTAELMGHRHGTLTYGTYGHRSPVEALAKVMEKALRYEADPRPGSGKSA